MRELGAFYETKHREILYYLHRQVYRKASITDISRYTGLRKDEILQIVNHDINLTTEHGGDYVKLHP